METSSLRPSVRPSAVVAFLVSALALAAATSTTNVATLPVPTTFSDFRQLGSSVNPGMQPMSPSDNCRVCHGGYDVNQEP